MTLRAVRQGRTRDAAILAASLTDGLGSPEFQRLMAENQDLKLFKQRILGKDYFVMDQWQLEELAKVVERCKVKVVSHGLPPETLRRCFVEPAATVEQAVAEQLGRVRTERKDRGDSQGTVCVAVCGVRSSTSKRFLN